VAAVEGAQRALVAGESYEVCLTDAATVALKGADALSIYLRQREAMPAPYGAFIRAGDFALLSSSPERFLRVTADGIVESKPIKGTRRRGADPAEDDELRQELARSAKDRAENMMVVDLVRNDLGRVCEVGSVTVPSLMAVESFSHVHQLVSTVRGRLAPDHDAIDAVAACFPAGSMTGAPKLRTMEIIDALEPAARGVYSGAHGYLGLGGEADLGVVIRSLVFHGNRARVGGGGAVTVLSDPEAEYEEMKLKVGPLLSLLGAAPAAVAQTG
jgi:para-aminobenzoate synthetase